MNGAGLQRFSGWVFGPSMVNDPAKVWIFAPSGEGGDFCREELEAVVAAGKLYGDVEGAVERFFWENF